jgi:putative inorganic carbon (HCO3(-)) transporter
MNWLVLRKKYKVWVETGLAQRTFELSLSLLVGLMIGALLVFSWGLPSKWQELIAAIPIAFAFVMLTNDLEKIVLAAIAISVPLNLDVSLIISPYAQNPENLARGHRTLVALTELRLSLVSVLLVIGYALWLIGTRGSDRKPVRFFPGTSIPALGLIFFSLLSVFQAQDWQLSLFRVVQLFELFLAYLYLANHIRTIQDMRFFIIVSMGGMLAESILMIVQWTTGLEFFTAGIEARTLGPGRVGGTFTNPNPAGWYLSAHLLIVLAMLWVLPKRSQKILAAICFITGSIALISTGSRTGWASFAVTFLIFISVGFWRGWMQRKTLVLLFIAVLVLGAVFYQPIYNRLTGEDRGSAESRPKMYRLAWNVIRANMWFGVGANNYALVARDYYTPSVGDLGDDIDSTVHNRYLTVWAETGLFGFLFLVGFLISPLIQVLQYILRSDNRSVSLLALGLGCAIASLGIQMFTDTFLKRSITLFVWLLPALVASLGNLEQTQSQPERTETTPKLLKSWTPST